MLLCVFLICISMILLFVVFIIKIVVIYLQNTFRSHNFFSGPAYMSNQNIWEQTSFPNQTSYNVSMYTHTVNTTKIAPTSLHHTIEIDLRQTLLFKNKDTDGLLNNFHSLVC